MTNTKESRLQSRQYQFNKLIEAGYIQETYKGLDFFTLNDGKYSTAYNDDADVVIKAVLTAQAPSISSDQSKIEATGGPAITSAADDSYSDKSPRDLIELVSSFGDGSGNTWYFAVWDNRIPYFKARATTTVNWKVSLNDLGNIKTKYYGGDLWNSCYAIYRSGGVLTRTAAADNTTSQTKYGVTRTYVVPDLGEVAAATAQAARDTVLNNFSELYPHLGESFTLPDVVKNANGKEYPSSWVRAGDVIRILDMIPAGIALDTVTRDRMTTFYIMETDYDADRGINTLRVDTESKSLDAILAKVLK